MIRVRVFLIGLLLSAVAAGAWAQDPQISISAEQEEVIVGQPFVVRVEVLVPTFMPKAPVFPTFEMPGLIVRLPERSTSPVSWRIEGQTWAGVQRTYRIYPMRAGVTDIPVQQLSVVYKDAVTNEDVALSVDVPATQIVATVPDGARMLDPLIIARDVSIEQSWQMADGEIAVGDAVVRKLEISVAGTSALFVPPLLDSATPQAAQKPTAVDDTPAAGSFLPYPEDARVAETMERGVMSGTRTETVSYIAQNGGAATFPDIVLSWYDLETGKVEDILLDGRTVTVAMPPRVRTAMDRQKARRGAVILVLVAACAWAAHRWLWPILRPRLYHIRAEYEGSAYAAHRMAERRAAASDLGGLVQALDLRTARGLPRSDTMQTAIDAVTRAIYRDGKTRIEIGQQWQEVRQSLRRERPRLLSAPQHIDRSSLSPLNPFE